MKFQINRIDQSDSHIDRKILKLFFKGNSSKLNSSFMKNENNIALVALLNQEPVGFLYGYLLPRFEKEQPMLFLYSIDVLPEFRLQGIGKKLIREFQKIARDNNCCKIFVIANEKNKAAMKLYQKAGAEIQEQDAVVWKWKII